MGIRSDVGIALKNEAMDRLKTSHPNALREIRALEDEHYQSKGGHLYIINNTKWYTSVSNDYQFIIQTALRSLPDEDYLVVEACFDYPHSDEGDMGSWVDNPWELRRTTSVMLNYVNE